MNKPADVLRRTQAKTRQRIFVPLARLCVYEESTPPLINVRFSVEKPARIDLTENQMNLLFTQPLLLRRGE